MSIINITDRQTETETGANRSDEKIIQPLAARPTDKLFIE